MWLFFALPAGWSLLIIFAGVTYARAVYVMTIYRPYPDGGLPDDQAMVRYFRLEPAVQIKRWKAESKPLLFQLWIAGVIALPIYVFNVWAGVGATLAAAGVLFYLATRRKRKDLPWWHGVHFSMELGLHGMM